MNWKKLLRSLLIILSRLRIPGAKPPMQEDAEAKAKADDGTEATATEPTPLMMPGMTARMRTVNVPAAVTFGPNCSVQLPRSQVLSLLRSDCRASPRTVDLIVLHCSATRPSQNFTIERLQRCHKARGYGDYPGYHLYVRRDGTLYYCRPIRMKGCHVSGHNAHSIGVCYEGGVSNSPEYHCEDNRTAEQVVVLDEVLRLLHECYPDARICGHHELNPRKGCPCLDPCTAVQYKYIFDEKND